MAFDPSQLLGALDTSQLEALVDTMVLAAAADGEISADEQNELAGRLSAVAGGAANALSSDSLTERIAATHDRISQGGRADVLGGVKSTLTTADQRKGALGLAVAVTAADGIIRTSEREVIMELADALDVDRGEAADLVRDVTRTA